jgi:hypothetical protein
MMDSVKINFVVSALDIQDKAPGGFVNSSDGLLFIIRFTEVQSGDLAYLCFSMGTPGSLYQKQCGLNLPFLPIHTSKHFRPGICFPFGKTIRHYSQPRCLFVWAWIV